MHRWENNLDSKLKGIQWKGMYWINLTRDQDRWWILWTW
jgi:hypothetical protein